MSQPTREKPAPVHTATRTAHPAVRRQQRLLHLRVRIKHGIYDEDTALDGALEKLARDLGVRLTEDKH